MFFKSFLISFAILNVAYAEWKPYDSPEGPKADGVKAGLFEGVDAYVGQSRVHEQRAPGLLLVQNSTHHDPGFYGEHSGKFNHVTSDIQYLAKDSDCSYEWVNTTENQVIENAVKVPGLHHNYIVGRVFSDGSWIVGKAEGVLYYGEGHVATNYEVLVCNKPQPVTVSPVVAAIAPAAAVAPAPAVAPAAAPAPK